MADLEAPVNTPAWLSGKSYDELQTALARAQQSQAHKERWKYTKVDKLLAGLSRQDASNQSSCLVDIPGGIQVQRLTDATQNFLSSTDFGSLIEDAPEVVNLLLQAGAIDYIYVTKTPDACLVLEHTGQSLPVFIRVAENVDLKILEQQADTLSKSHQHCLWLQQEASSRVIHARNNLGWDQEQDGQILFRHLQVHLARDAVYTLQNHSVGAATHRQNIHINCAGPGAHAQLLSASLVPEKAHLDQQITVQHTAPHSTSRQTVHNIAGQAANVTFNGRIHIHAHCPGVQAHLSNKNLGVAQQANINTKPELEIYTDDVQCSHGATVGQLDENHLFYCASRGINPDLAKQLLSTAFLNTASQGALAETAMATFAHLSERMVGP